jgi:hypothetical protein
LCVTFAGLKIDQATGGSCRGRLSLAAVVAVLGVAGGGYLVLAAVPGNPSLTDTPPSAAVTTVALSQEKTGPDAAAESAGRSHPSRLAVGLLVLGAVAGLVLSLASQKTRAAGLAVLALAALAAVLGVLAMSRDSPRLAFYMPGIPGPAELLVLAIAAIPVAVVTIFSRNRWAWILGFVVCLLIPALVTPADPLSMIVVAVPLCCIYPLAVLAWTAPRKAIDHGRPTSHPEDPED